MVCLPQCLLSPFLNALSHVCKGRQFNTDSILNNQKMPEPTLVQSCSSYRAQSFDSLCKSDMTGFYMKSKAVLE